MPEERAVVTRLKKPEDWIKRQLDNLKAVGEANFKVGIAYPKKDTIAEGIAAEDKFEAAMKKALEEERRKKALEFVTLQEWYGYSKDIGAPRLVEGVTKREKEVKDFVTGWQPILLDHVAKIDVMPEVTDREREERILANLRGLKAAKGTWRK